jgi:hypothetical protein
VSRWFRHYAGMMRDEKLVRVAIRSKQPVERVVWVYAAILESAAEIDDDGRYDLDAAEAAYFLRTDEADVVAVVRELEIAGRLAEGCVAKWGSRQFQSDRSAERVARHRERKRQNNVDPDKGNADVTLQERPCNAPETETELDTDSSEANASGAEPPADPIKEVFDLGVSILTESGCPEKQARSLIGKWRAGGKNDGPVLVALLECRNKSISEPVEWLTKRLQAAKWVSKGGYEYRGSDSDVMRTRGRGTSVPIGNLLDIAKRAGANA